MKLSEVIDGRFHSYFSEEKGSSHIDMSFGVADGCMSPCGCDLSDYSPEAFDEHGFADHFGSSYC